MDHQKKRLGGDDLTPLAFGERDLVHTRSHSLQIVI
jgi:hypothetical protein